MKLNFKSSLLRISLLLALLLILFVMKRTEFLAVDKNPNEYHAPIFFDEKSFFDVILSSEKIEEKTEHVSGGVIPHHLLASDIIVGFFESIPKDQTVERVVLIGPNHYERGDSIFTTSLNGWENPIGNVLPDIKAIEKMRGKLSSLGVDADMMEQEHSIGGIIPFVSYYLPDAKIIPLSISRQAKLSDLEKLTSQLNKISNEKTIFISSVDFSHYLSFSEAEKNDKVTLDLLKTGNLDRLLELNEDYVDSPESLALLLLVMEEREIFSFEVLDHKNSADYTQKKEVETTSYYSLIY